MQPEDIQILENLFWRRIQHLVSADRSQENYLRLLEEQLLSCRDPVTDEPASAEEINQIRQRISLRIDYEVLYPRVEIQDPAQIRNIEGHTDWYLGWLDAEPDQYHWIRHREHLINRFLSQYPDEPERAARIIRTIDNDTDKILELMENPNRTSFKSKGLVVGYVQSGKTANFTALIAKAVDAGYKFIIVLTGIHNTLRSQTQERIDRELTGSVENGIIQPDIPHSLLRLTSQDLDFSPNNVNQQTFVNIIRPGYPLISIMKKNHNVMEHLIEWVHAAPENIRRNIPLLVIDDEADQASIDTHYGDEDDEPSRTNERIRRLLTFFSRHTYIGYTATPFANVLIDLAVHHEDLGRDLYPRNFIVSLNRPEGYIGSSEVFRSNLRDMYVRLVPQPEADNLITHPGDITQTLERAIMGHFLACAVRCFRGDSHQPMSMLIHTSHLQVDHQRMHECIDDFLDSLKSNWRNRYERAGIQRAFEEIWNTDYLHYINEHYPDRYVVFEDIVSYIEEIMDTMHILELNYLTDDELDYTLYRRVIAIGGNKLSRGLTLEGLLTSFYLRESRQYDTLLQMGRWFGFRENYEDLTRIYTTPILDSFFEELANVEQELREEILQYEAEGITPLDVSVRIRTHRRMRVTARNKMGAARIVQGSYSKRLVQTIWFPLNRSEILRRNLDAGSSFIQENEWEPANPNLPANRCYISRDISNVEILAFLDNYQFASRDDISEFGSSLDPEDLKNYIRRENSFNNLLEWNVAVVGKENIEFAGDEIVNWNGLEIVPVSRSRLQNYRYKIGALSDPNHLTLDYPDLQDPYLRAKPLLILYRISRNSRTSNARKTEDLFKDLTEKVDVLGLVIVFPQSRTTPNDYVSVLLSREV